MIHFNNQYSQLLPIYQQICNFTGVEYHEIDFKKNYQSIDSIVRDSELWIKKWKTKEANILSQIEEVYGVWKKGRIQVGLFPTRKLFWKFSHPIIATFFIRGNIYICLFPTILNSTRFSFNVFIHELFHAHHMLDGKYGSSVSQEEHEFIISSANKIFLNNFPDKKTSQLSLKAMKESRMETSDFLK